MQIRLLFTSDGSLHINTSHIYTNTNNVNLYGRQQMVPLDYDVRLTLFIVDVNRPSKSRIRLIQFVQCRANN